MSGSVKKVFTVIIVAVACVLLGAFVLNVLFPNVTNGLVNAVEGLVFNATGISMDFNGDGAGNSSSVNTGATTDDTAEGAGVSGFTASGGGG